jgi:prophage tail gpP-like protein
MLNIQENDYIWVRTKDKKYFDGIVERPYLNENLIAIKQQADSVCMPFGTIVINVDDIECFRKKEDKEDLYCEEMLLPKKY